MSCGSTWSLMQMVPDFSVSILLSIKQDGPRAVHAAGNLLGTCEEKHC